MAADRLEREQFNDTTADQKVWRVKTDHSGHWNQEDLPHGNSVLYKPWNLEQPFA